MGEGTSHPLSGWWHDQARRGDVGWVFLMMLASIGGVGFVHHEPEVCAVLMAGVLAASLWRWHTRLDLLMAATGAVFGPLLEYCATTTGLWHYPHVSIGTLPAWVFTLWPAFPIVLLRFTCALLPAAVSPRPRLDLVTGVGVVALEIVVLVSFGNAAPWLCAALTGAMLLGVLLLHRSPHLLLMVLLSGIFGTGCETLPVALGAWSYPSPAFLGMPAWLPTGYSLFGLALVCTAAGIHGLLPSARARWGGAVART